MSLPMKRLACCLVGVSLLLAACGDNRPGAGIDAAVDAPPADMAMVDADVDAMTTPGAAIAEVRAAPDSQPISLPIIDATVTYLKPAIAGATPANDSAGFTIQAGPTGPALFVAVDPATLTTLTPALAVGDVVSFTVTEKKSSGTSPRATQIENVTRSATGTSVASLVQDITAVSGIAAMIGDLDSELVDVTAATIMQAWGPSGSAFSRTRITTTGQAAVDDNFQLRLPTMFKDSLVSSSDLGVGCVVAIHRTPVNRFAAQFQVSAFTTTDLTITSCPAPTVASATATGTTTVTVTFSRNIDMTTLLANGSQFTIVDDAMPTPNMLPVSAAVLTTPRTITLTTDPQTPSTSYTVTVANTLEDVTGGGIGAPDNAAFAGYVVPIPTVMMAAATSATTVTVTFTRPIDMTSVQANGSQFTIVDDATPTPNELAISAASVSGMVVTLTTDPQLAGEMYTVTVENTVTDTNGTPLGAPLSAAFLGFSAVPADHLVINEIDYDQNGSPDNAEFIEIYNPTASAISLVGKRVVLINGDVTAVPVAYGGPTNYNLDAAGSLDSGQYLVLGPTSLIMTLPSSVKTIAFAGATDQVQQGPRDGVALIDLGNAGMSIAPSLIDVVFYEGNTTANLNYDANGQMITIVPEGLAAPVADLNNANGSVCRNTTSTDTNDNAVDIGFCTMQTPGAVNTP